MLASKIDSSLLIDNETCVISLVKKEEGYTWLFIESYDKELTGQVLGDILQLAGSDKKEDLVGFKINHLLQVNRISLKNVNKRALLNAFSLNKGELLSYPCSLESLKKMYNIIGYIPSKISSLEEVHNDIHLKDKSSGKEYVLYALLKYMDITLPSKLVFEEEKDTLATMTGTLGIFNTSADSTDNHDKRTVPHQEKQAEHDLMKCIKQLDDADSSNESSSTTHVDLNL